MERNHRAKTVRRGSAACVLALVCLGFAITGLAQDAPSDSSRTSSAKAAKTGATKASNLKTHKGSASGSKVSSSSSAKAHPAAHPTTAKHPKSSTAVATHTSKTRQSSLHKTGKKKTTARGQQKIEPERAQAIQEALIREHYMTGEAAGTWNQTSEDAMRRYQADHGWQSKTVPDSRALISLGLGPSHDHLLNPESAMTTGPDVSHAASVNSSPQIPVSHSAEPGARTNTNSTAPTEPAPATPPAHDAAIPQ